MRILILVAPLLLALIAVDGHAQTDTASEGSSTRMFEEILVTGGREGIRTLAGSATLIDEEAIAQFDVTDVNDLLAQVPGVYVRYEDGYGLRPNIGIRGATAERSQKITLMEDGILITPAPYSAPAAYYLPNVNRMAAVEVFKGPSAIQYGPHTVGGAMNMATRPIPQTASGEVNLTYGSHNYHKSRLFYGDSSEQFGFWVDALRYGADGFKELDGGGDTGFVRNDFNTKVQWRSRADAAVRHKLDVKLGYADEESDETYLGLTDADFVENPLRRYRASQLDRFTSTHSQIHLLHLVDFQNGWRMHNKAYVNRFDRAWNKFDGFIGLSAAAAFEHEDSFPEPLAIMRGDMDSDGSLGQTLDVTENAREYGSQGLEVTGSYAAQWGRWQHEATAGARYHYDYVDRDHSVRGYHMRAGDMVPNGDIALPKKALNRAETDALAVFIKDEISIDDWILNLGLRSESIKGQLRDDLEGESTENTRNVLIPGFGVFYQWTDSVGLLLGVNKGFSPHGPGVSDEVEPEQSVNYEYGVRYQSGQANAEVIGFFSDYSNLLGRCRASDAGCTVDEEFNGGDIEIGGVEVTADYALRVGPGLYVPIGLVYTYTESAFRSGFESDFSQWGSVNVGDELPYTAEHQARISSGLQGLDWSVDLAVHYIGEMREEPGQGTLEPGNYTEAYSIVNLAAHYELSNGLSLRLVGENLTDKQEIVSRRPFGARPNAPRTIRAGVTFEF